MIEETKRSAAMRKYVAGSEEFAKMKSIKKEMEDLIIDRINSTYSEKEVDIAKKYRNSVYFQQNISIEYELSLPWRYRSYLSNMDYLELKQIDKPAIILTSSDFLGDKSALKETDKDLYDRLYSKMRDIQEQCKSLQKKLDALDKVLSDKSMNITSIKKYYPELYNLMS